MRRVGHRGTEEGKLTTRGAIFRVSILAGVGVIGFVAAGSIAFSATRTNATVSLRKTQLGSILVSSRGHTLYLFAKDRSGKSACTASCAKYWVPLVTAGKPTAGSGVKASLLGTTKRANGSLQVTYNKHPLYTYVLDKQAGQTSGEAVSAFGAKWYAVSAKGIAVMNVSTSTATTTSTTVPYP